MNIPNIDSLDTYILTRSGYDFEELIEGNPDILLVIRREGNKNYLGCYTSNGWFNGKSFGAHEYWFDGIDTQETTSEVFIEFRNKEINLTCKLEGNNFIVGSKGKISINDIIESSLSRAGNTLN